jgi:predicted nucleic-acid-binding Zn-ribbon protein
MTHVTNIPHILEYGITHRNSPRTNPKYKAIGDSSLISFRETKNVWITNGRQDYENVKEITLGDYIPFYFGYRTPMLYVVQKGGNLVPNPISPEEIVYLVSSVQKILDHQLTFYFSNGHATDGLTEFYDSSMVSEIENLVDFQATKVKYWINENDLDLKRRKEAEFVVKEDLPVSCILGYICYSPDAKEKLLELGINDEQIWVNSNYYF